MAKKTSPSKQTKKETKRELESIAGIYVEQRAKDSAVQFGDVSENIVQSRAGGSISFVGRDDLDRETGGVRIGNVTGGIHGSIIAGRDVRHATISLGGQNVSADEQPTFDEFKKLLEEIQQELVEVTAQQDTLKEVSVSAPFTAQGAEALVKEAAGEVKPDTKPEEAKSIQEKLTEASALLNRIAEGATKAAEKTGKLSGALNTLVEKIVPLVTKIGVAGMWVYKLWPWK